MSFASSFPIIRRSWFPRGAVPGFLFSMLLGLNGCGDDEPVGSPKVTGEVGSACRPRSQDCAEELECADELTGGAAYSVLFAPLPAVNGYCSATCKSNDECGEHGVCFGRGLLNSGGECRRACATQQDCGPGLECASAGELKILVESTCQPLPVPDQLSPDEAGRRCFKNEDCGEGYCAESGDKRGGYCTGVCIANENCGAGGVCIRGPYGSRGTCQEACEHDSDCQNDPSGWGCSRDRICVREANPLPAVGDPCSPDGAENECGGGSCRIEGFSGERYPGGYCVGRCDEDSDCGSLGVCINELTCFRTCQGDSDCRAEYSCQIHPQATGDSKQARVCFPRGAEQD